MTDGSDVERVELTIELGELAGARSTPREVSGILLRPDGARWIYVLAHGAGAGMRHAFLEKMAALLAERDVATLRYQFPYVEAGRRMPDKRELLEHTVRAAVAEAARRAPDLPLLAGGKSMGGRMTSQAQAAEPLPGLRAIVFIGFPLHPPGKPSTARAEHLPAVGVPMLFLQGTRDELASLSLLEPVVRPLAPAAELVIVDGADHSFGVRASSGRRAADVLAGLADEVAGFASRVAG